ncbi:hypothetical protein [Mesorhizobium loti]|uniref:hypothetical protein n=1 Tax=Rhizobium loti TaxID=381 RepID=UPI0013788712|nr:hypothetical protein [Mesorhizobium loti]
MWIDEINDPSSSLTAAPHSNFPGAIAAPSTCSLGLPGLPLGITHDPAFPISPLNLFAINPTTFQDSLLWSDGPKKSSLEELFSAKFSG